MTLFWGNDSLEPMLSKKSKEKKFGKKGFAANFALFAVIIPWLAVWREIKPSIPSEVVGFMYMLWIYYSIISDKEKFIKKLRRKLEKYPTRILYIYSFSVLICSFLLHELGLITLMFTSSSKVSNQLNKFREQISE